MRSYTRIICYIHDTKQMIWDEKCDILQIYGFWRKFLAFSISICSHFHLPALLLSPFFSLYKRLIFVALISRFILERNVSSAVFVCGLWWHLSENFVASYFPSCRSDATLKISNLFTLSSHAHSPISGFLAFSHEDKLQAQWLHVKMINFCHHCVFLWKREFQEISLQTCAGVKILWSCNS